MNFFLTENPGTGKGDFSSRYKYITKRINGHEVYLRRPAQFNTGFDFTLIVANITFNSDKGRSTTRPTHTNILDDLHSKKNENLPLYKDLLTEIEKIYKCQNTSNTKFNFVNGHQSEIVLECIKWLFAEQDVTYWNYSGRAMFYAGILAI